MKALSLLQPWASLLFATYHGQRLKLHETRSWQTHYQGPLAIHASRGLDPDGRELCLDFAEIFRDAGLHDCVVACPRGCILGMVVLTLVLSTYHPLLAENLSPHDLDFGNYAEGRYAWRMENPKLLTEPIPCNGALSLWEVPAHIARIVEDRLPLYPMLPATAHRSLPTDR